MRRPDKASLRPQRVRIIQQRLGTVRVPEITPWMYSRELGRQLVIDTPGRQPGRGDDVEVAASRLCFRRRLSAGEWCELVRPGQLARGEGFAVGRQDGFTEVSG